MNVLNPIEGADRKRPGYEEGESINEETLTQFFETCKQYRELLTDIHVVVPIRPGDGMNCGLSRMLSIWYGEGTGWSQLNDHMGGYIEITRANIAYDFKYNRSERFLLMIDNDMEPPIDLLLKLARHDKPVVGSPAMALSKEFGPQLCFTVLDEDGEYRFPALHNGPIPAKGLVRVGHCGTGAILIRRDVFDAFTFESGDIPFYVPEEARVKGAKTGHLLIGEDIAFCNALRSKGIPVFVDLEAHCGHRKTIGMLWDEAMRDPAMNADDWRVPASGSQKFSTESQKDKHDAEAIQESKT